MKKYDSIKDAVIAAQNGDREAYGYLYETTAREKRYIALKYMRNEADAEDVLSESYVRALENLRTLDNHAAFSSWLGKIVAATAINTLKKKKPLLFPPVSEDDDEDFSHIPDAKDERIENQPELSYTDRERSEIIKTMLDSLPDEQRLTVIMYYMEDMSAPDIAEIMGCPVSTVKSRIKYAKDNLRAQAESLKKKGYEFYGIAPVPFLLYVLQLDAASVGVEASFVAIGTVGSATANGIVSGTATSSGVVASGTAVSDVVTSGTLISKIVAGLAGVGLIAGLVAGGVYLAGEPSNSPSVTASREADDDSSYNSSDTDDSATTAPTPTYGSISEDELSTLVDGGHSFDDLEKLLLYAPDDLVEGDELTDDELSEILLTALNIGDVPSMIAENTDFDEVEVNEIPLEILNRYVSAVSDHHFSDKSTSLSGITVFGDAAYIESGYQSHSNMNGVEINRFTSCHIDRVVYSSETIEISYTRDGYYIDPDDPGEVKDGEAFTQKLTATLKPVDSGKYRVVSIQPEDN